MEFSDTICDGSHIENLLLNFCYITGVYKILEIQIITLQEAGQNEKDVNRINNTALQKLAETNGTDILEFERIIYLNTKRKIKHTQAPEKLSLTKGCQVMLLYNLDIANGLVNGSRGIVIDFMNDT